MLFLVVLTAVSCGNEKILPLTVTFQDEEGNPIEGASVRVSKDFRKLTDRSGEIRGNYKKQLNVTTGARKEGYYQSNSDTDIER